MFKIFKRRKPNLFILGGEKCGTTSLAHYLQQHPDIILSNPKEPIFFEAEYEKGIKYYLRKYFKGWKSEMYALDARHRNLYLPYVPERIKALCPDAVFLILIRNPAIRALSHWKNRQASGRETLSFFEAIEADIIRIKAGINFEGEAGAKMWEQNLVLSGSSKGVASYKDYRTYVDTGYYDLQISRYYKLFDKKKFMIIMTEELGANTKSILKDIFNFLQIDDVSNAIDVSKKNVSTNKVAVNSLHTDKDDIEQTLKFLKSHYSSSINRLGDLVNMDLNLYWN